MVFAAPPNGERFGRIPEPNQILCPKLLVAEIRTDLRQKGAMSGGRTAVLLSGGALVGLDPTSGKSFGQRSPFDEGRNGPPDHAEPSVCLADVVQQGCLDDLGRNAGRALNPPGDGDRVHLVASVEGEEQVGGGRRKTGPNKGHIDRGDRPRYKVPHGPTDEVNELGWAAAHRVARG